jgi:hypothetical protein
MKKRVIAFTLSAILLAGFYILIPKPVEGAFLKDYLIWDAAAYATGNNNSGPRIDDALKRLGFCGDYAPVSASDLLDNYTPFSDYAVIFICFGTFPDNYVFGNQFRDDEVDTLLWNYITFTFPPDTPRIYLEGGDAWISDPWMEIYNVFQIDSLLSSGGCFQDSIRGVPGTCMEGLLFQFGESGGACLVKRALTPPDTAVYILEYLPITNDFSTVGYRNIIGQYISIGSAFEFGEIDIGAVIHHIHPSRITGHGSGSSFV